MSTSEVSGIQKLPVLTATDSQLKTESMPAISSDSQIPNLNGINASTNEKIQLTATPIITEEADQFVANLFAPDESNPNPDENVDGVEKMKKAPEDESVGKENLPPLKDTDFCDDIREIKERLFEIHEICRHIVKDHPLYTLATAVAAFVLQLLFGGILMGLPLIISAVFLVEFIFNLVNEKSRNEMFSNFKNDWNRLGHIHEAIAGFWSK